MLDWQLVFLGKAKIALVMSRHAITAPSP